MAVLKCKMCGGDIIAAEGQTYGVCDSCGSTVTLPNINDQRMENLFNRANHFRMVSEFDKALATYEMILNEDNSNAEAHWGLLLSCYGIEYVEDPASHERIPTCHRIQNDSILSDGDYLAALEYAPDGYTRSLYEAEGKRLSELQRGLLQVSAQTEPFDIFICYKESTEGGSRTKDSALAQDIYYQLTNAGYKVFFSRITLEDKLGKQYEPYIFAALNSAKVMLAIGTKPEYFTAVWVKNEWSRFLALAKKDRSKLLIPCYRDMNVYDLPDELSMLQSQDMSKIGFMQDLLHGIEKVISSQKKVQETTVQKPVSYSENPSVAPLLKRAFIFLEDGDWQNADAYCEKVLDADPENGEAYLGKLMVEMEIEKREMLFEQEEPFDDEPFFKKAMRYGDESLKKELNGAIRTINDRIAKEQVAIREKLQTFQAKYRGKRLAIERKHYEEIKAQNDAIQAKNDAINAENERIDARIEDAKQQLTMQRQIYAENERKIFGAGARAKKDALAEISKLESEIDSLKWKKHPLRSLRTLPKLSDDADAHDSIGNYVKFGVYPQTESGKDETPIEWLVLDRYGDKVLLLSRYGLDGQQYNEKIEDITWENCTLRKWLNKDFINRAFNAEEQSAILMSYVDNSQGWSEWDTDGGNDTHDKVFLLSYAEANKYLGVTYDIQNNTLPRVDRVEIEILERLTKIADGDNINIQGCVAPTAYVIAQQGAGYTSSRAKTADGKDVGWWWLRSPAMDQSHASVVHANGTLSWNPVELFPYCVRPAIWVNLKS